MKIIVRFALLLLIAPTLGACAYFNAEEAPPIEATTEVETIDLMSGQQPVIQQDVRDVIFSATDGRVEIFSLDGRPPMRVEEAYSESTAPLVSTVGSALNQGDMVKLREVPPLETALPGGTMLPHAGTRAPVLRSMDPSVDVFPLGH